MVSGVDRKGLLEERSGFDKAVCIDEIECYKELRFSRNSKELKTEYKRLGVCKENQLIHSLMNIEYNAIIAYQLLLFNYKEETDKLPREYFTELLSIIEDENRHFWMLDRLLRQRGFVFGEFMVNTNILKDLRKCGNLLDHICLISLTHEGKGIDAGPRLLESLTSNKEMRTVIDEIVRDEERHVGFGVKWYRHLCSQSDLNPQLTYKEFLNRFGLKVFNPNTEARERINFDFY